MDPDNKNSAIYRHPNGHYMLSTAHTLDDDSWLLRPVFEEGLSEGLITEAEAAYFQIFTVPGMPGCVSFNCPRIAATTPLDPLDPADVAYAYQTGRQQIQRLVRFCIAKIGGFEAAFLAQMAPQLGVRESRRIRGQYIVSDEDILGCRRRPWPSAPTPSTSTRPPPKADKGGAAEAKGRRLLRNPASGPDAGRRRQPAGGRSVHQRHVPGTVLVPHPGRLLAHGNVPANTRPSRYSTYSKS
ncbi:MAG: FAD-dependent oxidoreductase [Vampirovibrionales bacterium]